ncbi:MAG TPA: hypothetical protein VKA09_01870 [Nitrososphaeraceae archaeon]|nr:hypothetical protein [Nitrososphaeraceae archaeon]
MTEIPQYGNGIPTGLPYRSRINPLIRMVDQYRGYIPFSIEGLLNWTGLDLNVSPIAAIGRSPSDDQVSNAPAIQPPAPNETAIELPYKLVISPNQEVVWKHRFGLFTSRGRTELWHTRLALKVPKTPITPDGTVELSRNQSAPLRAIWSLDYKP